MQYLCKIFFKVKLIRKIIGRNSYETDIFPPNPAGSDVVVDDDEYDYDVSNYCFLVKSFEKFGKSAENTLHCVKICNEGINLHVHSRQFSKRHH